MTQSPIPSPYHSLTCRFSYTHLIHKETPHNRQQVWIQQKENHRFGAGQLLKMGAHQNFNERKSKILTCFLGRITAYTWAFTERRRIQHGLSYLFSSSSFAHLKKNVVGSKYWLHGVMASWWYFYPAYHVLLKNSPHVTQLGPPFSH